MPLKPFAEIRVPMKGYCWNNEKPANPYLQTAEIEPADDSADSRTHANSPTIDHRPERFRRVYDPFEEEPKLFLVFSELKPTMDAILDFANEYGRLDRPELAAWEQAIPEVKKAVKLWQDAKKQVRQLLSCHHTRTGGELDIGSTVGSAPASSAEYDFDSVDWDANKGKFQIRNSHSEGGVLAPAQDLLTEVLLSGPSVEGTITPWEPTPGQYRLRFRVRDLLSVIWTQLRMAVCESPSLRDCLQCGQLLLFTLKRKRSDRKYCSQACIQKAYRQRRAQACKMRKEHMSLREIAKALGSKMKTVKKWVGEA